ncbi:hypothetical protein LINPERHAP1_LOCUS26131, partial [Linum perenne]
IGLARAWDLGIKKVILELEVVSSIEGASTEDSRHGLIVHQIQQLRSWEWQVVVRHFYREANQVVGLFAHFGHSKALGTHFSISYPTNIRSALLSNCIGFSFPILISFERTC